ncbi:MULTISPECIES: DNA-binding domain-containing protein [Paenibacillaceae]|uniref:Mu DNA binding I gamma subdomain domain-containing protein n=2 Tax=Paenibacillaceae TaxID=186822 RepID=A0A511VEZ8_9BACL|nr:MULTISPECIES: DNA-binding domain-containing protein [Paenibacillaceae]MUG72735.1 hypothetical protein [Paenibacillus validus]GEN36123.1 hypothetical protein ADA01nite_35830 [Aneurinibacillus danicus]
MVEQKHLQELQEPIIRAIRDRFGENAYERLMKRLELVQKAIALESVRWTYDKKCILAMSEGVSVPTLYRWTEIYKKNGLLGLVPKNIRDEMQRDQREKQFRSMDKQAVEFVTSMYQQAPRPSVPSIYRQLLAASKEKGWKVGSLTTCYRIVRDIMLSAESQSNL